MLIEYIKYGFPLVSAQRHEIKNNLTSNSSSANQFPEDMDEYLSTESGHSAILGPFVTAPHKLARGLL